MSTTKKNHEKADGTDSDDDFQYEEVSVGDDWSLTEGEEDLEATVKAIQTRAEASGASGTEPPEAVDDFLRNFLCQMGMTETLDSFQTEWTEMEQKGQVDAERVGVVPDVYTQNQRLDGELRNAQREREEYRLAASAAAGTLVRAQKARDFHRRQHKRVVQEKNRLIEEMKKLKVQSNSYEHAIKRMNEKHRAVLRQTMQVTLGRDKVLSGQVNRQESKHSIVPPPPPPPPPHPHGPSCKEEGSIDEKGERKPIQPSPPTSANTQRSWMREHPVKANVP
ncbi:hypothetical protein PAMA_008658 [Pampus argenteus]